MLTKALILIGCVINWYRVPVDKIFGGSNIIYKFRNGVNIICRTKSTDINEAVVVLSGREYPENIVRQVTGVSPIVVDLGGNIGAFALLFNQLNVGIDYSGFSFEPHPGNAHLLRANLTLNKVHRWKVVAKAASGTTGCMRLDVSGDFDAFKLDSRSENYIEVESVRLSDFCIANGIQKIDLLKMDIEGGEYDILDCDLFFLEASVNVILLEYHNLDSTRNLDYVLNRLKSNFSVIVEHSHAGGGIVSAIRKIPLS